MKCQLFPPLSIYELGQRSNQEDALYPLNGEATSIDRLFVLCDGMGGHEKGEVASQTVCQSLGIWFAEHVMPDCPFSDDMLHEAIEYAFAELDKRDDGAMKKMGTTLTLIYMHRHGITAAHIGDSRIYHIRPISPHKLGGVRGGLNAGVLYQSRDHSLVFDLFQSGEITYEEMAICPQKNIITRAMQPGMDNRVRPDIVHITNIYPGDYFFLCSDGMLEEMSNEQLVAILSERISDEEKRKVLVKASANSKDNHSAWLIHVNDVIMEKGDDQLMGDEATTRFNVVNILRSQNDYNDDDVRIVAEAPKTPLAIPNSELATVPDVVAKTPNVKDLTPQTKNSRSFPVLPMKSGRKGLFALLAIFALIVFCLIGYGLLKPSKPKVSEDSVLSVPIQRPMNGPAMSHRQYLINNTTKEVSGNNKISVDSNKIVNGKHK